MSLAPSSAFDDLTDALVARIAHLQSPGSETFTEGLFPTYRTYWPFRREVPDTTIFLTALVLYTLQSIRDGLSDKSQCLVDEVLRKGRAAYPRYLNNQGFLLYNFWQNHPEEAFFPNGRLFSRFRHFRLPEDYDSSSYPYLTQDLAEDDVRWFKQRLLLDVNGHRRRIRNTLPRYRDLPAYSTWLGDANMPLDFDVCAMCNLLLVIFHYGLPLNEHDHATIAFIRSVILADEHLAYPLVVAPWYGQPTVILYHVARLMDTFEVPGLGECRDKVIGDLARLLPQARSFMERLLLSTSLMRLGRPPAVMAYPEDLEPATRTFYFVMGAFTTVENPFLHALAKYEVLQFRYRCPAHVVALVLEHEVYRRRTTARSETA